MAGIGIWRSPIFPPVMGGAVQLGTLIENDWNPANWSGDTGACTFAGDGITLGFSGTGFAQGIYYNKYNTNLENFRMECTMVINSKTSYGPSMSMIIPSGGLVLDCSVLFGTGIPNDGRVDLWSVTTYIGSDATTITVHAGDTIQGTLQKIGDTITVKMKNLTTSSAEISYSATYNFNYPFTNLNTPIVNSFGFSAYYNCDAKVTSFKYTGLDYKNTNACIISDSKGLYFSGGYANTLVSLLRAANVSKSFDYSGGANETLADVILKLPELISYNSGKYFIYAGCNDYRLAQSASITSRLNTIKSGLEAGVPGTTVYFVNSTIEDTIGTGIGVTGTNFVNACGTTVFGANCIDTSSVLLSDLVADGIHPNALAMPKIQALIQPYI